jgi:hypothetical protein
MGKRMAMSLFTAALVCAGPPGIADHATSKADMAKQGYVTDIDFTGASPYSIDSIQAGPAAVQLRTLDPDIPHASRIYGVYSRELYYGDSPSLSLYPNGKFAVTEDCDICARPTLLFYGTWREKDGVISFTLEEALPARDVGYEREYGRFGDMLLFVVQDGKGIGRTVLVPKATLTRAPIGRYLVRRTVYVDWQHDLSEVESLRQHPGGD